MREIADLLNDFSINSILGIFINSPKELENFGYEITLKSKFEKIQIFEKDYFQKYFGNIKDVFVLNIKRECLVKAHLHENSQKYKLFKENLVYEGRFHVINLGNGEIEALPSFPIPEMANVFWNLCKSDDSRINLNNEMKDFELGTFPK